MDAPSLQNITIPGVTPTGKKVTGIPYSKPTLSKKELKSVLECMVQDEISYGKVAHQMERDFANSFEFRHALSAPTLSSAYHLAFLGLELAEGDEVVISAMAPVALLDALGYVKAKPVPVDLARDSFHPDCHDIISRLNEKTRAIVLNYNYGAYHNYDVLREFLESDEAKQKFGPDARPGAHKKIRIIEDISYIAGVEQQGRFVGAEADIAIIGLYADMLMTIGKGAMVLTDNRNLFSQMKDNREHDGGRGYRVRYDYSITDYQAAMGLEQLGSLTQILDRRRKIGEKYMEAIRYSKLKSHFHFIKHEAYAAFPIITETDLAHAERYFQSLKIETRRTAEYGPICDLMGLNALDFPNAQKLWQRGLLIPLYPYLTKMNVERMIGAIRGFI